MRLVIERQARTDNNRVSFISTFRVVPEQPVPRSAQYFADVPLEDLAKLWFALQEQPTPTDHNALLVADAENWTGATLRAMLGSGGLQVSSPSPIVAAAVEERFRRSLALLYISDQHDTAFLKNREEVLDVPSDKLAPSGKATCVLGN